MPTVSDDFNRADNASSLGATSVGGKTWIYQSSGFTNTSVWGISSNQAKPTSGPANDIWAIIDGGTQDGTISAKILGASPFGGVIAQADLTGANASVLAMSDGRVLNIPGFATVASGSAFASGDTMDVIVSGTSVTVNKNGVLNCTGTIVSHPTWTYHGIYGNTSNPNTRLDNFNFAPASGGGGGGGGMASKSIMDAILAAKRASIGASANKLTIDDVNYLDRKPGGPDSAHKTINDLWAVRYGVGVKKSMNDAMYSWFGGSPGPGSSHKSLNDLIAAWFHAAGNP